MPAEDYLDGFFEGHEGAGVRWLYRLVIVSLSILSVFCIAANPILVFSRKPGATAEPLVNSIAIGGLLGFMFINIAWYKRENQSPGHRYAIFFLMACIFVLDIGACIAFNKIVTYEEPAPSYVVPDTTTTAPTFEPTTPGPNPPNMSDFRRNRGNRLY